MLSQVIIRPIRNAPQLAPAKGEEKLNIRSALAVEAQLLRRMIAGAHFILFHAQVFQPVNAELAPVREPLQIGTGFTEELQLHLLKFPGTERKVPGVISFRKDFPIWPMPKGIFLREVRATFLKFTKIPWAVSGRRYTVFFASSVTPWKVLNIRLN